MKTKQIGQLLLKAQAITPEQLDRAISIQQEEGGLLGQILVRIEACNKGDIGAVIKKQRTITTIMLGDVEFGADAIALLTREFCERNRLVPFEKIGSILCVAMANVLDTQAKNDIKEMTQLQPKTYDATWQDIKAAIDRYYGPPPSYDNDPAPSGSSEDELIIELPDEPERNLQRDAHSLSEEAEGDLIEDLEALGIEEVYSGETVYAASPMAHRAAGLEDFDTDAAEEIEEFDALEGIVEVAPPAIDFAAEEVDAADEVEEYIPEAADLGILEVTEVEPVQTPTPEEKAPKGPALPARVMAAIPASLGYFTEVVQWGRANAERRWLAEHLADNVLPARPALGLRPA